MKIQCSHTHTDTHTHTHKKYAILGTEIKIQGQLQVRIHSLTISHCARFGWSDDPETKEL